MYDDIIRRYCRYIVFINYHFWVRLSVTPRPHNRRRRGRVGEPGRKLVRVSWSTNSFLFSPIFNPTRRVSPLVVADSAEPITVFDRFLIPPILVFFFVTVDVVTTVVFSSFVRRRQPSRRGWTSHSVMMVVSGCSQCCLL